LLSDNNSYANPYLRSSKYHIQNITDIVIVVNLVKLLIESLSYTFSLLSADDFWDAAEPIIVLTLLLSTPTY